MSYSACGMTYELLSHLHPLKRLTNCGAHSGFNAMQNCDEGKQSTTQYTMANKRSSICRKCNHINESQRTKNFMRVKA